MTNFFDLLRFVMKNMFEKKSRVFITISGIIIGIFTFSLILLTSEGIENAVVSQFSSFGLDVLVETHNREELVRAIELGSKIIGVNNRNLHNFEISLDVSRELISPKPKDALMICESGLSKNDQLEEMRNLGFDGFLIGESLMRSDELELKLGNLANTVD